MNAFFTTLLIAISLSMDAFSLALVYGLQPINKNNKILLSLIVGLYHFFMPLIGLIISIILTKHKTLNLNVLVAIIFIIIGIEMIISNNKPNKSLNINIIGFLLFGLSVSIDSLTTGIGLEAINKNYIQVCLTFAIVSSLFTYSGLILGNKINKKYGSYSTIIGGLILIFLSFYYIF